MNKDELKNIIIDEILNVACDIEKDKIPYDEKLQISLEIDSYDFLNILIALAQRVGIEVPESDYEKVDTLEHIIDYFYERL